MTSRKGLYNCNVIWYQPLLHTKNVSARKDLVIDVEGTGKMSVSTGSALPGDISQHF